MLFLGGEEILAGFWTHSGWGTETIELCNRIEISSLLKISMIGSDAGRAYILITPWHSPENQEKDQSV